ncbi:cytochrome c oxidase assembly protein [Frankia sp. Cppng1_Ct_nod]|uniref:cytochrome c oxidase assembly protein n=1 Tax=Frankia sp. Cppng1_Ct_nod TaxID=2897162 RepID=UPI0010415E61|nr:cytochrome c oxidase assembly protein [Frankia sp. Cppng1_Ct_nod]
MTSVIQLLAGAAPLTVGSYHGPVRPSLGQVWTMRRLDPVALALITMAAAGYLCGVARVHSGGGRWPAVRTVAFLGPGLTSLLVLTMGWPGVHVHVHVLFWAYIGQILGLFLVTPVFLAVGRPAALARAALPTLAPAWVARLGGSRLDHTAHTAHTGPAQPDSTGHQTGAPPRRNTPRPGGRWMHGSSAPIGRRSSNATRLRPSPGSTSNSGPAR